MSVTYKRAALELHSLVPEDREWVLGRLPAAEQARVRPLLAELDDMNIHFDIESDADSVDDEFQKRAAPVTASAAPPMPARNVVRDATAADVVEVLSPEPAWMINAVLALEAWPWSTSVRTGLAQRGIRLPHVRKESSPPPALATALVSLLAERLRHADGKRPNGVNGHRNGINGISVWHRVWPKVKQWLT